jgi:hypothetical protein
MVICDDLPGEDVLPAVVAVGEFGPEHSCRTSHGGA